MALVQAPSFCKMDLAEQKTQPYSWQIGRDSVVDCLSNMWRTLHSHTHTSGYVTHACNSVTQSDGAGGSGVQCQAQLHSEYKTSLGYMRPYL